MKTKEEIMALKTEIENLNKKLAELTEDELKAVIGGTNVGGVCGKNDSTITNGYNGDSQKLGNPFIGTYDGNNKTVKLDIDLDSNC